MEAQNYDFTVHTDMSLISTEIPRITLSRIRIWIRMQCFANLDPYPDPIPTVHRHKNVQKRMNMFSFLFKSLYMFKQTFQNLTNA